MLHKSPTEYTFSMIQRIQSLYLLAGVIAIAVVFLFDAAWPGGHTDVPPWMPGALFVAALIAVGAAIWALFLYKDRKRQHRVVLVAQVATIGFIVVLLYGLYDADELTLLITGPDGPWKMIAILLPFVAYILFFLARKAIERDIELVRSMDRLR